MESLRKSTKMLKSLKISDQKVVVRPLSSILARADKEVLEFFQDLGQPLTEPLDPEERSHSDAHSELQGAGLDGPKASTVTSTEPQGGNGHSTFLFSEICDLIDRHPSLQRAEIPVAGLFIAPGPPRIRPTYLFLILELRREGKATVWLRLERLHRDSAMRRFRTRNSPSLITDAATFSADQPSLIGSAEHGNRQCFGTPPTLGELSLLLRVVVDELKVCTPWPDTRDLLYSLLQRNLSIDKGYTFGLQAVQIHSSMQERVEENIRLLHHIPESFSFAKLLQSTLLGKDAPHMDPLLTLSTRLAQRNEFMRLQDREPFVNDFFHHIAVSTDYLIERGWNDDAFVLLHSARKFLRRLGHWSWFESTEPEPPFGRYIYPARFLHSFRAVLSMDGQHGSAYEMSAEILALKRALYKKDTSLRAELVAALQIHSSCAREIGKFAEACGVALEAVILTTLLHAHDAEEHRAAMLGALTTHLLALRSAGRFGYACDVSAEAVALSRALSDADPTNEKHRESLSLSLHEHTITLRAAGRLDEACDAEAAEGDAKSRALVNYSTIHAMKSTVARSVRYVWQSIRT